MSFSNPLFTAVCNTVSILCFVVLFLLCYSPASKFYVPTFWKTLFHCHRWCKLDCLTLCNFTIFSVSVHTQIGAVVGAEHTPTTERETGRLIVFPESEFQHQLLQTTLGRASRFQSCTVSWATGTYCYRHLLLQALTATGTVDVWYTAVLLFLVNLKICVLKGFTYL
jgi:hypothetical protein